MAPPAPETAPFPTIRQRLNAWFLILSLAPLAILAIVASAISSRSLRQQAFDQLSAVRELKAAAVRLTFEERLKNVRSIATDPTTVEAMQRFSDAFDRLGPTAARSLVLDNTAPDTPPLRSYRETEKTYAPRFQSHRDVYGYHDIFLVNARNGHIVYSLAHEDDFGTSLINGPYAKTNIGEAFRRALKTRPERPVLVDFALYAPSAMAPASFMAAPIGPPDTPIGVLVCQTPIDTMNRIMREREGIGETVRTYLIGPDLRMRSQIPGTTEPTLLRLTVDTPAARRALRGNTDTITQRDYRDVPVLSAFGPVRVEDLGWAIAAEIETSEALAPVRRLLSWLLAIAAGAALLAVVATWVSAHNLSRPIVQAAEVSVAMAEGDLDRRLEPGPVAESVDLAHAFNTMAASLQKSRSELETRVRERTAELADANEALRNQIRERKVLEKQLRENQQFLRDLLNNLPLCVYAKTVDNGRYVLWNAQTEVLTDRPADQAIGKNDSEIFGNEIAERYRKEDARAIESHAVVALPEQRFESPALGVRYVSKHKVAVRDAEGNPLYVLAITEDVTERRRLRAAMMTATENEQRRIGSDIHDGLIQYMSGIAYMTAALARELTRTSPDAAARAERIRERLEQAIDQAHRLARSLCPASIEERGIVGALDQLAQNVEQTYEVPCLFHPDGVDTRTGPLLGIEADVHLYRIAQEAIRNAIQHGEASRIEINLHVDPQEVRITIADDGQGIADDSASGLGMRSMTYRAQMLGGRLKVSPGPQGGTVVSCTAPRSEAE